MPSECRKSHGLRRSGLSVRVEPPLAHTHSFAREPRNWRPRCRPIGMIFGGELGHIHAIRVPKVAWAEALWSFRAGRAAAGTHICQRTRERRTLAEMTSDWDDIWRRIRPYTCHQNAESLMV